MPINGTLNTIQNLYYSDSKNIMLLIWNKYMLLEHMTSYSSDAFFFFFLTRNNNMNYINNTMICWGFRNHPGQQSISLFYAYEFILKYYCYIFIQLSQCEQHASYLHAKMYITSTFLYVEFPGLKNLYICNADGPIVSCTVQNSEK